VVAAAMVIWPPPFTQVRVLNGDTEHVYGPGGQLLDDRTMREKYARAEERRRVQRERAEYERRMQSIQENSDRAMADIRQSREAIQESAERRARNNAWNLH
jgi:hypothetical protein